MTRNDHIGFSASVGSERCPHNNEIRKICFSCRDFWHACIGIRSIAKEFAAAVRAEKLRCLGRYFNCFGACRTFRIDETHDSFLSPIDGSCVAYSCAPHGIIISFGLKARRGKGVGGSFPRRMVCRLASLSAGMSATHIEVAGRAGTGLRVASKALSDVLVSARRGDIASGAGIRESTTSITAST